MELLKELQAKRKAMNEALAEAVKRGKDLAEAEKTYQVGNSKFILTERAKGTPATLILSLAKGGEIVSELRYNRDIAQTLYESANKAIDVYKIDIRSIENQIAREWGQAKQ